MEGGDRGSRQSSGIITADCFSCRSFLLSFHIFPLTVKTITSKKYWYSLAFFCVHLSCEQGLEPEPLPPENSSEYGIAGTVYFQNWPPQDSVRNLAIIAFKTVPRGNLINAVLDPQNAKYRLNIAAYGVDSVEYELLLAPVPSGMVRYIAVGQQYGPNILADWRVAGLYSSPSDTSRSPDSVYVPQGQIIRGIDIFVDFDNPPPQP